ncbi:NUDIX hydrolase [Streptomyces sp. NPDC088748]|uniref:NUDIX hydrolase n=1 Tax=Streptomyces sp. NPDC088748 TaxID=3365887 RepID=UPI0037FBA510
MKIPPSMNLKSSGSYCLTCGQAAVSWRYDSGRKVALCTNCGILSERALVIDSALSCWIDKDGEYWHETAGVFVLDNEQRCLFFERTAFPPGLTIPAGHIEEEEAPCDAATRELHEETGLTGAILQFIARQAIAGDGCRRGSDAHVWHIFSLSRSATTVRLGPEGTSPAWLTLAEALTQPLTLATRRLINDHAPSILAQNRTAMP